MIKLELLQKEDLKKIVEWNEGKSADFLLQWAGPIYKYPLTEEQLQRYYTNYITKEKDTMFVYKIVEASSGSMIGTVELDVRDPINMNARVGRFLIGEESCRGKGIGKQALKEIVRIGFEELKLKKITLGVFDFNTRAINCYKSVGFEIEELKENYRKTETGWWNLYDMGITVQHYEGKYK